MSVIVVLGSQWGDEGKGKLVDYLTQETKSTCVRFNGGSNAGHTVIVGDVEFHTHVLPSGLIVPDVQCIMGNGMVINLEALFNELNDLKSKGVNIGNRLYISDKAHITLTIHKEIDSLTGKAIGTTKQGIGPTYSDRARRVGLRMGDLLRDDWENKITDIYEEYSERFGLSVCKCMKKKDVDLINNNLTELRSLIKDTTTLINLKVGVNDLMFEGANATMLDVQFGTYPYVTSSDCTIAGVFTGSGLNPSRFYNKKTEVIGVVKAYTTRVGGGVLPTEDLTEFGETMGIKGKEFGVTTKRKRRCGWLDLVQMGYSNMINGFTSLNLTKLDVLSEFDTIKVCVKYVDKDGKEIIGYPRDEQELSKAIPVYEEIEGWKGFDMTTAKTFDDLHPNIKAYIKLISDTLDLHVKYINTGPERDQIIVCN